MPQDFDKAFFEATFTNFLGQIFQKQLSTSKIQMQLIRKFEGKTQWTSSHMHIIKSCRKSIQFLDNTIKDIKEYFNDLKIADLYQLIQTIFRIMVYNVKKISQCYLKRFQQYKIEKGQQGQQTNTKYTQINGKQNHNNGKNKNTKQQAQKYNEEVDPQRCICQYKKKQDARKMQRLDFIIAGIQARQQQIQTQMNYLINDIQQQKQNIDKISVAAHQAFFEDVQKIFVDISHKSQYMFQNFYKQLFQQQYNSNFMQPERFDQQIFLQFKKDLKGLTRRKIQKITEILNKTFQNRLKQSVNSIETQLKKQLTSKKQISLRMNNGVAKSNKILKWKSVKLMTKNNIPSSGANNAGQQKQKDHKASNNGKQGTQKNINFIDSCNWAYMQSLLKQIQELKQKNSSLSEELNSLKQNYKKQYFQKSKMKNEIMQLQNLYRRKTNQLEQSKTQLLWTKQKSARESSLFAFRKTQQQQREKQKQWEKEKQKRRRNRMSKSSSKSSQIFFNSNFSKLSAEDQFNQMQKQVQVQTQANMSNLHQYFQSFQTFFHDNKPIISLRNKTRKTSAGQRQKQNIKDYQNKFMTDQFLKKSVLSKIIQILYQNTKIPINIDKNTQNIVVIPQEKQRQQIEQLLKQQKYEQVILKMRIKLDKICTDLILQKQKQKQKSRRQSKKKMKKCKNFTKLHGHMRNNTMNNFASSTAVSKAKSIKRIQIDNKQYVDFGVQTDNQTTTTNNSLNNKSKNKSNKQNDVAYNKKQPNRNKTSRTTTNDDRQQTTTTSNARQNIRQHRSSQQKQMQAHLKAKTQRTSLAQAPHNDTIIPLVNNNPSHTNASSLSKSIAQQKNIQNSRVLYEKMMQRFNKAQQLHKNYAENQDVIGKNKQNTKQKQKKRPNIPQNLMFQQLNIKNEPSQKYMLKSNNLVNNRQILMQKWVSNSQNSAKSAKMQQKPSQDNKQFNVKYVIEGLSQSNSKRIESNKLILQKNVEFKQKSLLHGSQFSQFSTSYQTPLIFQHNDQSSINQPNIQNQKHTLQQIIKQQDHQLQINEAQLNKKQNHDQSQVYLASRIQQNNQQPESVKSSIKNRFTSQF